MLMEDHPLTDVDLKDTSVSQFTFDDGYRFCAADLGKHGVKLSLTHDQDDVGAAVILPPEKVEQFGRWLARTLGQDRHGLPVEIRDILRRLNESTPSPDILQRGDKKKIKQALRTLRS